MIDKTKVTEAVREMIKNPDWAAVLKNAPGAANLRIALAFYASKNLDTMSQQEKDEYREFREMLESQLNALELKYLSETFGEMGVETAKTHYNDLFLKKPPEEQNQAQQQCEEILSKMGNGSNDENPEDENGDGRNEGAEESGVGESEESPN